MIPQSIDAIRIAILLIEKTPQSSSLVAEFVRRNAIKDLERAASSLTKFGQRE